MKKIITLSLLLCFSILYAADGGALTLKVLETKSNAYNKARDEVAPVTEAYFGDLHLHTTKSFDAYGGNQFNTPEMAFRYARGFRVINGNDTLKLDRPYDFLAVTDHAEYQGNWGFFERNNWPQSWTYNKSITGFQTLGRYGILNFALVFLSMWTNIYNPFIDWIPERINVFRQNTALADKYYEPGKFTTFPAFEWTDILTRPGYGLNNHRNVIFQSSDNMPIIPMGLFRSVSLLEQRKPVKLWNYMSRYRRRSGKDVLAIPHNMNMSNGKFDKILFPFEGYLKRRVYNEPIWEVTQHKGQSMVSPRLSPNDEFANYRLWEKVFGIPGIDKGFIFKGGYVRDVLKGGLNYRQGGKTNPFQVGFIGSSDSHDAKSVSISLDAQNNKRKVDNPAGVACVWATENTREGIFAALRKKETFATDGSRMKIRLFAGYQYPDEVDFSNPTWATMAYERGVPMGGKLGYYRDESSPKFLIWAEKDMELSNLDRIQIVKVTASGSEKIYDVAWWGNRSIGANGKLPAVVSKEELNAEDYDDENYGAVNLSTVWQDPEFNPHEHAAYYLRVLEVPNVFDKQQLRGWSSPVYIDPFTIYDPRDITETTDAGARFKVDYRTFPNPLKSYEKLYVTSEGTGHNEPIRNVKVLTANNQLLLEKNFKNNLAKTVAIDVSSLLTEGVYYIVINDVVTKKVMLSSK